LNRARDFARAAGQLHLVDEAVEEVERAERSAIVDVFGSWRI
jgi:hypothetical protein